MKHYNQPINATLEQFDTTADGLSISVAQKD